MKKIIFAIVFISILSNVSFGQAPQPGDYITNSNIDKFEGTWKWVSGNKEVIIKLKKVKFLNRDYHEDILLGCHSFTMNGSVVESSMAIYNLVGPDKKGTLNMWNTTDDGPDKITGSLKDLSKDKFEKLKLEYIAGNPAQLIWNLQPYEGPTTKSPGVTLPENITLIKQ